MPVEIELTALVWRHSLLQPSAAERVQRVLHLRERRTSYQLVATRSPPNQGLLQWSTLACTPAAEPVGDQVAPTSDFPTSELTCGS